MRHFFCLTLALASFSLSMAEASDEEQADPVSKAEFVQAQDSLFSKADKDFNGIISFHELNFAEFIKLKNDSKEEFKTLDLNSNNFLSEEEIIEENRRTEKEIESFTNGSKQVLLRTYDLNRNGAITSAEIDDVLEKRKRRLEKASSRNGKKEFKKIDKDANGYVSVDEFVQAKSRHMNALLGNSSLGEYLMRDRNGDRVVHRDEHREFVEALFLILDKNNDDKLSHMEQQSKTYVTFQTFDLTGVFTGLEKLLARTKTQ